MISSDFPSSKLANGFTLSPRAIVFMGHFMMYLDSSKLQLSLNLEKKKQNIKSIDPYGQAGL